MFWNKYKQELKTANELKHLQEQNITDEYSAGIYNGMEIIISALEHRSPNFKFFDRKVETIEGKEEEQEKPGRTLYSGRISGRR